MTDPLIRFMELCPMDRVDVNNSIPAGSMLIGVVDNFILYRYKQQDFRIERKRPWRKEVKPRPFRGVDEQSTHKILPP